MLNRATHEIGAIVLLMLIGYAAIWHIMPAIYYGLQWVWR